MSDRKRGPNWHLAEKILLVDLVTEHFSIIENKRTDAITMRQKNAEWAKIAESYNCETTFTHRAADNLKAQWESLKKSTRKEAAAVRQSLITTGGGLPKPKNNDPLYDKIMGLISTTVTGLQNPFDSDNMESTNMSEEVQDNFACVEILDKTDFIPVSTQPQNTVPDAAAENIESIDKETQNITCDWGDYTPKMLQGPKSAPLRFEVREDGMREDNGRKT
ncbi:hypothetical protein HW555_005662 [Spodoptera exigua]|uniref:Regulatory protein zeste n=1 Tax=Spodoptera exigua TaxID=7107 RepID=A0A835GK20_SPOEX|nr:hypothetical protein HW555_005662 [Spodoptera exigua]